MSCSAPPGSCPGSDVPSEAEIPNGSEGVRWTVGSDCCSIASTLSSPGGSTDVLSVSFGSGVAEAGARPGSDCASSSASASGVASVTGPGSDSGPDCWPGLGAGADCACAKVCAPKKSSKPATIGPAPRLESESRPAWLASWTGRLDPEFVELGSKHAEAASKSVVPESVFDAGNSMPPADAPASGALSSPASIADPSGCTGPAGAKSKESCPGQSALLDVTQG